MSVFSLLNPYTNKTSLGLRGLAANNKFALPLALDASKFAFFVDVSVFVSPLPSCQCASWLFSPFNNHISHFSLPCEEGLPGWWGFRDDTPFPLVVVLY